MVNGMASQIELLVPRGRLQAICSTNESSEEPAESQLVATLEEFNIALRNIQDHMSKLEHRIFNPHKTSDIASPPAVDIDEGELPESSGSLAKNGASVITTPDSPLTELADIELDLEDLSASSPDLDLEDLPVSSGSLAKDGALVITAPDSPLAELADIELDLDYLSYGRKWNRICGPYDGLLCYLFLTSHNPFDILPEDYHNIAEHDIKVLHGLLDIPLTRDLCAAGRAFQSSLEDMVFYLQPYQPIAKNVYNPAKYLDWPRPRMWPENWNWPTNPLDATGCDICKKTTCDVRLRLSLGSRVRSS
ncbi:hypothetical protein B0T24DRAFT_339763 [Lasiosphaeria ovina]|uniref:Uncharacterized protein n=1 Tax=Lasiosphaeria ovina TaxID=92902 RepID=A0AAE0K968_9PEZI|nr:hypothetical protein B0T24DRAFT_339763 [Lasiosphaeria ovina]